MNPRYFIGISLPDHISSEIESVQKTVLEGQDVMQSLLPHITLLHPNILMTLSPLYFLPQVKPLTTSILPLSIEITDVGMFDKRVLYISVSCPALLTLQKQLVEILPQDVRARYEIGREYTPHITIAQAKPLHSIPDDVIEKLRTRLAKLLPQTFECTSLQQFVQIKPRQYKIKDI